MRRLVGASCAVARSGPSRRLEALGRMTGRSAYAAQPAHGAGISGWVGIARQACTCPAGQCEGTRDRATHVAEAARASATPATGAEPRAFWRMRLRPLHSGGRHGRTGGAGVCVCLLSPPRGGFRRRAHSAIHAPGQNRLGRNAGGENVRVSTRETRTTMTGARGMAVPCPVSATPRGA